MAAIIVNDVVKTFQTSAQIITAVDNLSVTISEGDIVALLGPNGAGKTTTIRMIAAIYLPDHGDIFVKGLSTVDQPLPVRRSIGIAHEQPTFYRKLTGRRNLQFFAELYDMSDRDIIHSRIDELAALFDLTDAIDQPVGGYSKGMKQKLSVAKALLHDPDILIMDEPWSGLSPGATRDLRHTIARLGGEENKTILISTHNLGQAELVADKLIIISHGRHIAEGTPDELRQKYDLNSKIIIRLQNPVDYRLVEELQNDLSFVSSVHRPGNDAVLEIGLPDFDKTPELVRYLVNKEAQIREIQEKIPSLEDIYLDLVEEQL